MGFIKICGINSVEAVEASIEAGIDALGFVFSSSPRQISIDKAISLSKSIPPSIIKVAVFLSLNEPIVLDVLKQLKPDWVQANNASGINTAIPSDIIFLPVYRNAGPIMHNKNNIFLYEGNTSGFGELANWHDAKQLSKTNKLILAGGLNEDNVTNAINEVNPWGIDVSSGVEIRKGIKDISKIKSFIHNARIGFKNNQSHD
jgi:phosphoribosylanthranilate isomerase